MSVSSQKGPIFDAGQCRCCGATKRCRLLSVEYTWLGNKEIYSDMFVDCFGLLLSDLDGEPEDRLICATCVSRLREAVIFKKQVLQCEEKLLQSKLQVDCKDDIFDAEVKLEMEEMKLEDPEDTVTDNELDVSEHVYDDASPPPSTVNKAKETNGKIIKTPTKKTSRKDKKTKRKLKRAKEDDDDEKDEGVLIKRMKELSEKLKKMEPIALQSDDSVPMKPNTPRTKIVDKENKALRNTVTIVENSFVCPFDTSFSDYFCVYCREVFTDPDKLREHTLKHDPMTYKEFTTKKIPQIDVIRVDCRLCTIKIDDIDTFRSHITSVHGKVLYSDVSNEFLKFRLTASTLSCTECNSTFGFFHALKKHMAEHFGTCICDICGAHYFEERMLLIHQKTHQKVDENYPCKECGKTFKSKHSRYLHVSHSHERRPTFACCKCEAVLFSYARRLRHLAEAHGEARQFRCSLCPRAYDSRKSLREHHRRSHLKVLKHQCEVCDKRFYLPSRLREHMAAHTGERNYRCDYCGKTYPRLRGLKVHMQTHSGEKKYRCLMCNASFTQNVNLKNHMKRQHQTVDMEESFQECNRV